MTKPQRDVVRRQQLVDAMNPALAALNDEMGQRSAKLLSRFYAIYIAPLEWRVSWLEQPWYKRVGRQMPRMPEIVEAVKEEASE